MKTEIYSPEKRKKAIKLGLETVLRSKISEITQKPFPVWAYIFMTRKCNLSCSYCYVTDKKFSEMGIEGASDDMGIGELKQAADKLYDLGTRWVSFFGGEPTVRRKELVDLVDYASKEKGMFTQLPTNGTLLKRNGYIDEIGEAGIDLLDVSLDSLARFDQSKKDGYHRPELFDTIMKARDKYGFGIKTNFVITKQNANQLEQVMDYGDKNRLIISIRPAMKPPIIPKGWKQEGDIYFSTSDEDVKMVDEIADKIIERKREGYVVSEPVELFEAMKRIVRGEKNVWNCDAGKYHLTINNNGKVMQCALLTSDLGMHFSDLNRDYFRKIDGQVRNNLDKCNDNCLAAAYFCAQHYIDHPLDFFKQGFFKK